MAKMSKLDNFKRLMLKELIACPYTLKEVNRIMRTLYPNELPSTTYRSTKRFLEKLVKYDLLHLDPETDKYVWKIHAKDNIDMVKHSNRLIPALKKIAEIIEGTYTVSTVEPVYIGTQNMSFLVSCAEDHLLSYPDIWSTLSNYREKNRLIETLKESFTARIKAKLEEFLAINPLDESLVHVDIVPKLICENLLYDHSYIIDTMSGVLAGFIEKETSESINLLEIEQIKGIQMEAVEARRELQEKIRALIWGILDDRTLRGGCKMCVDRQ